MLVIKRRLGESILIASDIEVQIAAIGRSKVKLAIRAPQNVTIVRSEVRLAAEENGAAANPDSLDEVSAVIARISSEMSGAEAEEPDDNSEESDPT